MSIIEKMSKIVNDGDVAAGEKMIHDDYQFLMHSSGNKLGKQDILKWLGMKDVKKEKVRVLFENDEVGFEHAFASYKDGNKEAVMTYYKYKDGKVVYMETGATKLAKNRKEIKKICLKLDYQWVVQKKDQSIKL